MGPQEGESPDATTWMATRDGAVPPALKSVAVSVSIGVSLVAPFVFLQWFSRRNFHEGFPFLLFTFMSLHALSIVFAVTPAVRCLRAERSLGALTRGHWAGLILGAILLWVYAGVVMDQLPCFLGVPNCD